jgi:hypothetical protein
MDKYKLTEVYDGDTRNSVTAPPVRKEVRRKAWGIR